MSVEVWPQKSPVGVGSAYREKGREEDIDSCCRLRPPITVQPGDEGKRAELKQDREKAPNSLRPVVFHPQVPDGPDSRDTSPAFGVHLWPSFCERARRAACWLLCHCCCPAGLPPDRPLNPRGFGGGTATDSLCLVCKEGETSFGSGARATFMNAQGQLRFSQHSKLKRRWSRQRGLAAGFFGDQQQ